MFKKVSFFLALFACFALSAVNYPYPQEVNYGHGSINVTSADASSNLKSKFQSFLSGFYEEGTCSKTGSCARIKFDTPTQTVSEGIAYGMLMMVYFSDNATSYQGHFDKLWAYYQNWLNTNGLMNWRITGFTGVSAQGQGAATDAEFDAALALVMAHYQFGSTSTKNYLDTAQALIAKIRQYEIDPNNLHRPGDGWNSERNPSYVSPASFEIFKEVESSQATKWTAVIDANYTLLENNQHPSTGLFSDWCTDTGNRSRQEYQYDAARTPWRLAWAYNWYGHPRAKTLLTNLYTRFLTGKTATNIGGSINYSDGTMGNDKNSTFLGPFTNALSYSSEHQETMNSYWDKLITHTNESYFNHALQVLTGLLATGNMPNLKDMQAGVSSSSVVSSSSNLVSSSSSDATPIKFVQNAGVNGAQIIKNGISLQVAKNASMEVFGLDGKSMRKHEFSNGSYSVQLGDLPKGLYIAKVKFGSQSQILRIPVR